eukprot:TRINITY_DN9435_c0_g3_i2.p3 TRINITY_DN9435_c0_g3~~TRINITY_DN9435_c0_g3_i2.p3  ORF type:complete len:142 (-),score=4.68 TRINITY_DN9435_c0_g3_i2:1977-2402(-)
MNIIYIYIYFFKKKPTTKNTPPHHPPPPPNPLPLFVNIHIKKKKKKKNNTHTCIPNCNNQMKSQKFNHVQYITKTSKELTNQQKKQNQQSVFYKAYFFDSINNQTLYNSYNCQQNQMYCRQLLVVSYNFQVYLLLKKQNQT